MTLAPQMVRVRDTRSCSLPRCHSGRWRLRTQWSVCALWSLRLPHGPPGARRGITPCLQHPDGSPQLSAPAEWLAALTRSDCPRRLPRGTVCPGHRDAARHGRTASQRRPLQHRCHFRSPLGTVRDRPRRARREDFDSAVREATKLNAPDANAVLRLHGAGPAGTAWSGDLREAVQSGRPSQKREDTPAPGSHPALVP